jgi:hypothetical protein
MDSYSEILVENSINAALASIEIYNKPDFKYREQTFSILNVNAWELLLKAKIVKDAEENIASLYVQRSDGEYKTNRSGNFLTIEVIGALNKLSLDIPVAENIKALVEIRDTVTHFVYDEVLEYVVFSLGVASLRNYQKLIREWFDKGLTEFNFHILPLAFAYDFRTLAMLDLKGKPDAIANLVRMVTQSNEDIDSSGAFHFVCEVTAEIRSAKKFQEGADFVTVIDSESSPETAVYVKTQNLHERYPLSYKRLEKRVKKLRANAKPFDIQRVIKQHNLKKNKRYADYVFTNKEHEERYKLSGEAGTATSIYNEDAVRFIVENLDSKGATGLVER